MFSSTSRRGQVLPLWIVSILATMALMFGAINYGNTLRWNIRAQSAADAAVQGLLSIQTQRWNEMSETLYAANVEEYRARFLLNGILMASNNTGPCALYPLDVTRNCAAVYAALVPKYLQSTQRYSADVALLHAITKNATFANWQQDADAFLTHIQGVRCNDPQNNIDINAINPDGGDCPFKLSIVGTPVKRTGLQTVEYNGYFIAIPGISASLNGTDTENDDLFAPIKLEVVACAKVPPVLPSFWNYHAQPYLAVARSAATSTMFVEDWFEPGNLGKPYTNPEQHFQNAEENGVTYPAATVPFDWYAVDFGGNDAKTTVTGGFTTSFSNNEFSVRVGWWNAIPQPLFNTTAPDLGTACPQ